MCIVKAAVRSTIITTKAEVVEAEVVQMDNVVVEIGLGIVIITIILTKNLLMHLHRHQTLGSRISPRKLKTTIKVRSYHLIVWITLLLRIVHATYEDLDFN